MAVISGPTVLTGSTGIKPMIKYMLSTDSLATVTAAGYLNEQLTTLDGLSTTDLLLIRYDYVVETGAGSNAFFNVAISGGIVTLSEDTTTGSVTYTSPSVANHLAVFSNTTGNITDDVATAINGGNLQAGLSGTAGTLASFPATGSKGSLKVAAVANTNNDNVTISNAAHGQATVISIPDGGQATAEFIISDSAGTQHITSGSLQVDAGNLLAGSSGAAGTLSSFPATASKGSLKLEAVANTGDTVTAISNAPMGQATTIHITDPVATNGYVQVSTTPSDPSSNLFWVEKAFTHTDLAAAGIVQIYPGTAGKQYKIREMYITIGTNFSGGGGDRNVNIFSSITSYSTVGSALLQSLAYTRWGSANMSFLSLEQSTIDGADISLAYVSGTTDYTAGESKILMLIERVV